MGLNRDYIGQEYSSPVSVSIGDIAVYSSAIGIKSISNDIITLLRAFPLVTSFR